MSDDIDQDEVSPAEARRSERLAALPTIYKRNDERMALELVTLAPEDDPLAVFIRYGYSRDEAVATLQSPAFVRLLAAARKDVDENGASFVMKSRAMAEELLTEVFSIAVDPLASAAVRVDVAKWVAKMGRLEPKEKDGPAGSGSGMTINITFAGQAQPVQVVNGREPITIEGGA